MVRHSRSGRIVVGLCVAALGCAVASCGADSLKSLAGPAGDAPRVGLSKGGVASASDEEQLIAQIRQSTSRYQNIEAAVADGYVDDGYGCIDATFFGLPASLGAMGFHMINWQLHDDHPETDPLRPDVLVYMPEKGNGKPKLVAIEWEVNVADWYGAGNTQPPSLFGHEFELLEGDGFRVFGLHMWLWEHNPSGLFSDWNPRLSCPAAS